MKDSNILKIAIALGVGVFVWQLVTLDPVPLTRPGQSIATDPWVYVQTQTEVVQENPRKLEAWRDLATAIFRAGDHDEALATWLEKAPPRLVTDYSAEGVIRYWFGRWLPNRSSDIDQAAAQEEMKRQFEQAISLLSEFIDAGEGEIFFDHYCLLGRSQFFAGHVEDSKATLLAAEALLDEDPSQFEPGALCNRHTWIALIWADMGERELAASRWDYVWEILELYGAQTHDVAWPTTWFEIASYYSQIEVWDRAEDAVLKRRPMYNASEVRTDVPDTWHKVGWRLYRQNRVPQAQNAWLRAVEAQAPIIESERNNFRHWYNLACFRALAGRPEEAIDAFEQCVDLGWRDQAKARWDDDLRTLQEMPRFQAALDQIVPEEELGVDRGPSGLRPPQAPRGG